MQKTREAIQHRRYSSRSTGPLTGWLGLLLLALPGWQMQAQTAVDLYVFEQNNRGFLNQAKVEVVQLPDNYLRAELVTDTDGHLSTQLAPGTYRITTRKDLFFDHIDTLTVRSERIYHKVEMRRRPGYLFDATIAEARTSPGQVVDAISGARVEIYNRTQKRPELVLLEHPNAFFQFTFEQGNHYTILLRKPGYIAKRIEARVNVEGCIICVDGVRDLSPGVTENLTAGNTMGTLLSNIELEKARLDQRIVLRNIYYDFDKWDIRPDAARQLDKVVTLMNDNPALSVELGSHTDSRGRDSYNDTLSQRRAEAAVDYIVQQGGISAERISAKGYGETQLTNRCRNGATCSEEEHQLNRRTELKITKINNDSLETRRWRSLEEIVRAEEFAATLKQLEQEGEVKIPVAPSPTPSRLPEANNSVPLPKLQSPAPPPTTAKPALALALPSIYSGYKVEVLQSEKALAKDAPLLLEFPEVYLQRDAKGRYCYFVGEAATPEAARAYLASEIAARYPAARLVQFKKGVKTYLK